MKVPPKRKGNACVSKSPRSIPSASMKVPPKRKGNQVFRVVRLGLGMSLNESPSEKEGKCNGAYEPETRIWGLNESPSKKEGKFDDSVPCCTVALKASMKALPKRKGNVRSAVTHRRATRLNESPSKKEGKYQTNTRFTKKG